ncbi:hypothetical protein MKZ02_20240 [Pseudobacillus sp. FSL P4-0506]|uniref:hypothetical protein n=1 Tax=Pseudobacillus sp. FSL P4-0506 TaxID=2921576 RepID=UPI0030F50312
MELLKTQTCPYCANEVEDAYAQWEDDSHIVECEACGIEYRVQPIYEFKGFEIQKLCVSCGEFDDDCCCE